MTINRHVRRGQSPTITYSKMISKLFSMMFLAGAVVFCSLSLLSLANFDKFSAAAAEAQLQARRVPIAELDSVHDGFAARQQRAIASSVTPATFPDADERDKISRNQQKPEQKTPKESPFGKTSELDVKCTNGESMQLVIKTRFPFDGLIYIGKSGARSPQCRLEGRGQNRHELTVSLRQCGVVLKQKTETHADYAAHVYVQYNSAIQQVKDDQLYSECRVPITHAKKASTAAEDAKLQQQQKQLFHDLKNHYPQLIGQPDVHDVPVENAWMEILHDNGEQIQDSGEFAVKNGHLLRNDVSLGERLIIAVKTPKPEIEADGNIVSDADVVMCRVHDNTEKNYEMLIDRYGCPMDSSIMPAFKTYDTKSISSSGNELVHYSVIQAFKFPDNNHLHFSCKVIYCAGPCPRLNCTSIELARRVERAAAEQRPANAYYRALEENERKAAAAAQAAAYHRFMPIPQDDIMGSGRAITLTPGSIPAPNSDRSSSFAAAEATYAANAAHYSIGSSRYKRDVEEHHILSRHVAQQLGTNAGGPLHDELLARHKRQVRNSYYYEDLPFLNGGGSANNVVGERDVVNSVRVYNNPNDTAQAAALRQGRENTFENGTSSNQTTTREQIPHGRLFCLRSDLFWAILGLLLGCLLLSLLIALLCCCKRRRRKQQKVVVERQEVVRDTSPYYYYSDSGTPSTGYQPFPPGTTPAQRLIATSAAPSSMYQYPPYTTNGAGIPPARLRR